MPAFQVIAAKRHHCGQIARRLRAEQAEATTRLGAHVHGRLVEVFDTSSLCRAWTIDGRVCGLGGLDSPLLSSTGVVWLALTEEACRFPVALMKEARRQLSEILQTKQKVVTSIFEGDPASLRFALHLGFERCGDPFEQNGQRLIPVALGG